MSTVSEKKMKLRQSFLEVRRSLTQNEYYYLSDKITDCLKNQPSFRQAHTIHIYVSMLKNREVSTLELIQYSIRLGKKVVVPKMGSEGILTHHQITSISDLRPNRWGVPEPVNNKPVNSNDISLVIVPMVAADFKNNRLGYGKGYYDRFLEHTMATRMGLCFNCTLSWCDLPTDRFDQTMDIIITESSLYAK